MTDTPSMRERMLAGELYIADDPELAAQSARARRLTHQLNLADPADAAGHRRILAELLGAFGEGAKSARRSSVITGIRPRSEPGAS